MRRMCIRPLVSGISKRWGNGLEGKETSGRPLVFSTQTSLGDTGPTREKLNRQNGGVKGLYRGGEGPVRKS